MMQVLSIGLVALIAGWFYGGRRARRSASKRRSGSAGLPLFDARRDGRAAPDSRGALATPAPRRRRGRLLLLLLALVIVIGAALVQLSGGQISTLAQNRPSFEVAVQLPLSGAAAQSGLPPWEGIQLAFEQANASGQVPLFTLRSYDDQGNDELARGQAAQIAASQAALVLGPAFSSTALATGPAYASAGLVSLPTNATSDQITSNPTTFRVLFNNSDQGELLAHYLVRALGQRRAAVFVADTAYGQSLRTGFARAAGQLGLTADYYVFRDLTQARQQAQQAAQRPQPVVLLTLGQEGAQLLISLRKLGAAGPFLGGDAFGKSSFRELLANQPEEQSQPGWSTERLYGIAPVILDSASAETLAFAERYRARFGHDPDWPAVSGYDAANLAIAAARASLANPAAGRDLSDRRAAVASYLRSLSSQTQALPGLLGPVWFDQQRGRPASIRVTRFNGTLIESAPLQIAAVPQPDPAELASGAVFELGPGRYARLQQVAYAGMLLNQVARLDLSRASFTADVFLWLRFVPRNGPGSADPTNLRFPGLISGGFDPAQPVQRRSLPDGSEYRLWHIQGDFHSALNLRSVPFDRQQLALSFFNRAATAEQLIYVVDQQTNPLAGAGSRALAAPEAFRDLSEWQVREILARREHLVSQAPLGDPTRATANQPLELSGFVLLVDLERHWLAAFASTLLAPLVMSLIMLLALFAPISLVRERLAVALVAGLAGLVPLTAINSQFGAVGLSLPVTNVLYVFFGLVLLNIIATLYAARLHTAGRRPSAARVMRGTRAVFIVALIATAAVATLVLWD